ncbi:MAG TPA: aromatic-ring-hydroxylating dioxygenase subunit beta [Alphaproteobacteria bacterium]|nr:aromatic-ring-hydroxylating dioxygenase subunit beta [Alphaproteobacteria bacterium]
MTTTTKTRAEDLAALRYEIEEFNTAYADCLDDGDLNDWKGFFTEDCLYKVIPRENLEQNLPLAVIYAEGHGGLTDRIVGVTKTTVFRKRYLRHFITNTRIRSVEGGEIRAEANYQVLETLPEEYTKILNAGRYIDRFMRVGGALKLKERLCVYDSEMVPATIVYPL